MSFILFAYFGPESMLPLTSIVATVAGVFLMFGRNTFRILRRMLVTTFSKTEKHVQISRPHFQVVKAERPAPSEVEVFRA
jgi:hypothetical protein